MIILAKYFKKKYALANGIAIVGVSIGQIIFTPLFRFLIDTYGWKGTMFIVGAIQMNGVAACALFRPLKTNQGKDSPLGRKVEMEVDDTICTDLNAGIHRHHHHHRYHHRRIKCGNFLRFFTNVPAMLLLVATAFFSMAFLTNLAHLPARAKEAGWSDDQSAMLLLVFAVVAVVTRFTHGWFVDRNYIGCFKLQLIVMFWRCRGDVAESCI